MVVVLGERVLVVVLIGVVPHLHEIGSFGLFGRKAIKSAEENLADASALLIFGGLSEVNEQDGRGHEFAADIRLAIVFVVIIGRLFVGVIAVGRKVAFGLIEETGVVAKEAVESGVPRRVIGLIVGRSLVREDGVALEGAFIGRGVDVFPRIAKLTEARFKSLASAAGTANEEKEILLAILSGIDIGAIGAGVIAIISKLIVGIEIIHKGIGIRSRSDGLVITLLGFKRNLIFLVEGAFSGSADGASPFSNGRNGEDDGEDRADNQKRLNPSGFLDPAPDFYEERANCL